MYDDLMVSSRPSTAQGEIARRLGVSQQVVQKRLFGAARGAKLVGGAIARLRQVLAPLVEARRSRGEIGR